MIEFQGTPGPWFPQTPETEEDDSEPIILGDGGKAVVARIEQPFADEDGLYRGSYDAALIAAAPDMLAALETLLNATNDIDGLKGCSERELAKQAIQKATRR